MTGRVAIWAEPALSGLIQRIVDAEGLEVAQWADADLDCDCGSLSTVVAYPRAHNSDRIIDGIRRLRLEFEFGGAIVLLSFHSRGWVGQWAGFDLTTIPGLFYVQLPMDLREFRDLLSSRFEMSAAQLHKARRHLVLPLIQSTARTLKHDFENRLALPLAHLREIEKLSHYSAPDPGRVHFEANQIATVLTRQKLESLQSGLDGLAMLTDHFQAWGLGRERPPMESLFSRLYRWLDVIPLSGDDPLNLALLFDGAKDARSGISDLLAFIARIRDLSERELENVIK